MSTDLSGLSSPTWTVTFQPGATYQYVCDNHPDFMFGQFVISGGSSSSSGGSSGGSSSSSSSTSGNTGASGSSKSGSAQTDPFRGTLAGTVASTGALKLAFQGNGVSKLKSGRYKVTVADRTPARSFVVQQSGHASIAVSGVSFVGTHSVTVDFKAGRWTFFTSAGAKSKSSLIVT